MTFHDKLRRLTEDRRRTVVSRRAGLPSTALNDVIHKQHMPSALVAFRLARVLGVDLDWLMDDGAEWPPVRVPEADTVETGAHAA